MAQQQEEAASEHPLSSSHKRRTDICTEFLNWQISGRAPSRVGSHKVANKLPKHAGKLATLVAQLEHHVAWSTALSAGSKNNMAALITLTLLLG